MSNKYKVHANNQFLGHYQAQDGFTAIEKAIKANVEYHPEILDDSYTFKAKKNILSGSHCYGWDNFPWLKEELGKAV